MPHLQEQRRAGLCDNVACAYSYPIWQCECQGRQGVWQLCLRRSVSWGGNLCGWLWGGRWRLRQRNIPLSKSAERQASMPRDLAAIHSRCPKLSITIVEISGAVFQFSLQGLRNFQSQDKAKLRIALLEVTEFELRAKFHLWKITREVIDDNRRFKREVIRRTWIMVLAEPRYSAEKRSINDVNMKLANVKDAICALEERALPDWSLMHNTVDDRNSVQDQLVTTGLGWRMRKRRLLLHFQLKEYSPVCKWLRILFNRVWTAICKTAFSQFLDTLGWPLRAITWM